LEKEDVAAARYSEVMTIHSGYLFVMAIIVFVMPRLLLWRLWEFVDIVIVDEGFDVYNTPIPVDVECRDSKLEHNLTLITTSTFHDDR